MRQRLFPLAIATCVLVFAVWNGAAGATESKPEWLVKKGGEAKVLKAGESEVLSSTITSKGSWIFKQVSGPVGLTVQCTATKFATGVESRILGPRGIDFGAFLFEGCSVTAPAGDVACEVSSPGFPKGQIRTQSLGFENDEALEGSTKTPYLRMRPESTRQEIVTIELKGGSCTHPGSYEIAGLLVARVDQSGLNLVHQWSFLKNTGTRLTFGGEEATFSGAAIVTLKSGNEWGGA